MRRRLALFNVYCTFSTVVSAELQCHICFNRVSEDCAKCKVSVESNNYLVSLCNEASSFGSRSTEDVELVTDPDHLEEGIYMLVTDIDTISHTGAQL